MDQLQELFEWALEWFCKSMVEGTQASLHIAAVDEAGERTMFKIAANDDEQMVANSKRSLSHAGITAFAGIGEGSLPTSDGPIPVLIAYLQRKGEEAVRIMAMPYRIGPEGELMMGKLQDIGETESWLD